MEETNKKIIVILDENNLEKALVVKNFKINKDGTFSYETSENIITMPLDRLIKVKEELK